MSNVLDIIAKHKIVAIIRLDDLSSAIDLTLALVEGGIRALEFTLTNSEAVSTIARVRDAVDDHVAVGAGSVISVQQVKAVADAGGQFIVSPVTKQDVIQSCVDLSLPTMPGAMTPSEIQQAWEWGADVIKIFPAHHFGAQYIKDVRAPLPHLRLMPTGGIGLHNMQEYIDAGVFGMGLGSSLIDKNAIANQDWEFVTNTAKQFSSLVS